MASDLQINIELAKALGWKEWIMPDPRNTYKIEDERVYCWEDGAWFKFDYRDPVVFVAICKRWGITTQFRQNAAVLCHDDVAELEDTKKSYGDALQVCSQKLRSKGVVK